MPTDMIAMLERNDPVAGDAVSTRSPSGVDLRDRIEDRLRKRRPVLLIAVPGPVVAIAAALVTIAVGLATILLVRGPGTDVVNTTVPTETSVPTTDSQPAPITTVSTAATTIDEVVATSVTVRRASDVAALEDAWWVERVEIADERVFAVGSRVEDGEIDAGMWVSENGDAWSPVDLASVDAMPGYQNLIGIASDGAVTVAVGLAAVGPEGQPAAEDETAGFVPLAIRSDDGGASWSVADTEAAGEGRMLAVMAVPGGGFLAGGDGVWHSDDGTTWERIADTAVIWELVEWNRGFVAAGQSGGVSTATMWRSEGGTEWQEFETPKDRPIEERSWVMGLTASDDVLVSVGMFGDAQLGSDAAVWTSRDGVEWTRSPHDPTTLGGGRYESMYTVVSLDGTLVAFGEAVTAPPETIGQAAAWLSEDGGTTWTRLTPDDEVFGNRFSGTTYIRSAAVIDGRIVAVGLDDDVGMAWVAEIPG